MNTQSKTASTLATPSITKVLDSKDELSNPGQTEDTLLTLSGTADPSTVVSLYDGSGRVRTASVTNLGAWAISSVQAPIGSHSYTIRALDGASSPAWVITVGTVVVGRENFESLPLGKLPQDTNVLFSDGLIGFFPWQPDQEASSGPYIVSLESIPALGLRTFRASRRDVFNFNFREPVTHFKLTCASVNTADGNFVEFYDAHGSLIDRFFLPVVTGDNSIELRMALDSPCVRFVLTVNDLDLGIHIDNFEWY